MLTLDPETWGILKDLIAAVLVAALSLLGYDRLIARPRIEAARRFMARQARAQRALLGEARETHEAEEAGPWPSK